MHAILAVTTPFFALVLCGYLAARSQLLPAGAVPGLNAFVLFFALPCLLFRFGLRTPLAELLDPVLLTVYVLAAAAIVLPAAALSLRAGLPRPDAALGALAAAFPNSGFMGVPLLVALLGQGAAGPVICTLLADLFVTSSLCIALAQTGGAAGAGGTGAAGALRAAVSNPLPWSIALGAGCALAGWRLPGPADTIAGMLADAATPVALFSIGALLWRGSPPAEQPVQAAPAARAAPWGEWSLALAKLLLHPLLVFALGSAAVALGAGLSRFQLTVLTLAAALPSASNVSLLAVRHGADGGRIARIILRSTVLAFASFSLLAFAFGMQRG